MGLLNKKGETMETTCAKVMQELASGERCSAEAEKHLAECPDCALFQRMCGLETAADDLPKVPEKLDEVILTEARRHAARRHWRIWKVAVPIAASFVLSFGIAFYSLLPAKSSSVPRQQNTVQSSFFDYDESLISLSCEVADGAALLSNVYDITNQGVQTI